MFGFSSFGKEIFIRLHRSRCAEQLRFGRAFTFIDEVPLCFLSFGFYNSGRLCLVFGRVKVRVREENSLGCAFLEDVFVVFCQGLQKRAAPRNKQCVSFRPFISNIVFIRWTLAQSALFTQTVFHEVCPLPLASSCFFSLSFFFLLLPNFASVCLVSVLRQALFGVHSWKVLACQFRTEDLLLNVEITFFPPSQTRTDRKLLARQM